MPWTLTVNVEDVNASAVMGTSLTAKSWNGSQLKDHSPPQALAGSTFSVTNLADEIRSVEISVASLSHATCYLLLIRNGPTDAWQWQGSVAKVSVSAGGVVINALVRRIRGAPTVQLKDPALRALYARANTARTQFLLKFPDKSKAPRLSDLESARGILLNDSTDQTPYFSDPAAKTDLHLVQPEPLANQALPGWGRFNTKTAAADPAKSGRFLMLEYGAVSPKIQQAPRFLVACWVPTKLLDPDSGDIDFLIWYTPVTTAEYYPADKFPFVDAYPYQVWAGDQPPSAFVVQRYVLLPLLHMTSGGDTGHHLSYLTAATRKSTAIVVPVCPAAPEHAYEAFLSQAGAMRLLKEVCAFIATLRQSKPAKHGGPPGVGNIAVAGLSAGVRHAAAVMTVRSGISPYADSNWTSDASAFGARWKDFWSFDAAYTGIKDPKTKKVILSGTVQFHAFLESCASWVQQNNERRLRIYKTDFTAGTNSGKLWDPRLEPPGVFQRMVKTAPSLNVQSSNSPAALSVADANRRFQFISVEEAFLRDPEQNTGEPQIPVGSEAFHKTNPKDVVYGAHHDAVPRMFLGHALLTSSLR